MFRLFVGVILLFASLCVAHAETYPSRPIRIIVPFGPGSGGDVSSRMIFNEVAKDTGASFVIDNRPGGNGTVGTLALISSTPDGYTVMMSGSSTHSLASAIMKAATYDPVKDFTHITVMTQIPLAVIVKASSRYKSAEDLISDVKANPGKRSYAYAAATQQVVGYRFHQLLGLDALSVPFRLSQGALTDVLGDRVDYSFITPTEAAGLIKNGQVRALVTLNDQRSSILSDVPSLRDLKLPSIGLVGWTGLAGPAGMSNEARDWLRKSVNAGIAKPALSEKLRSNGIDAVTGVDTDEWVRTQLKTWTTGATAAGLQPE